MSPQGGAKSQVNTTQSPIYLIRVKSYLKSNRRLLQCLTKVSDVHRV